MIVRYETSARLGCYTPTGITGQRLVPYPIRSGTRKGVIMPTSTFFALASQN
jgi:hypothetical protein